MFDFNFHFAGTSFPLTDIILSLLTVIGTALATFLAARYAGKNANEIAEGSNEHQQKLQENLIREDTLNQLLVSYNTLYHYIEAFYDEYNDTLRINALKPKYTYNGFINNPENYIDTSSIELSGLNSLGEVILHQTKEFSLLEVNIYNALLKSKRYFSNSDYEELEKQINSMTHSFKYNIRDGSVLVGTQEMIYSTMGMHLVHLYNRSKYIKYCLNNPEDNEDDSEINLDIPSLIAYKSCYESHMKIEPILDKSTL